jgi:hypothetical protein
MEIYTDSFITDRWLLRIKRKVASRQTNPTFKCTNIQDINCIKCKRPWKIKSSYCDKGTHYKCEKLSDEEITKIKKDKTTDHHCKIYVCHKIPLTQH